MASKKKKKMERGVKVTVFRDILEGQVKRTETDEELRVSESSSRIEDEFYNSIKEFNRGSRL